VTTGASALTISFVVWLALLIYKPEVQPASGLLVAAAFFAVIVGAARRRQPWTVWIGDSQAFAQTWPGKMLVAAPLLIIPALVLLQAYRLGRYVTDSWTALLMAAALLVGYALWRRVIVAVVVAAVAVTVTTLALSPKLSEVTDGDAALVAQLHDQRDRGMLTGIANMSVALVDSDAPEPVRVAGLGASARTPMEVGSITKAMTGLVIADAVRRGEVRLDVPVSEYLPQLAGSPAGTVTLHELATHTAGYVDFGSATFARGAWKAPFGRSFTGTSMEQMIREVRQQKLASRGTWVYSNLGAATAAQAVAAAAGLTYPELMRTRLFAPLKMNDTRIQMEHALVAGGTTASGLGAQPWLWDAYAPAGAAVSTAADLAKLAAALLDGTAPGLAAMMPTTATARAGSSIGIFWATSGRAGSTVTWHTGQTGGYSAYLAVDLARRTAVVVLCDSAPVAIEGIGLRLLGIDR
jgi:CubicO group peptidase (beta-lactamase class C family)